MALLTLLATFLFLSNRIIANSDEGLESHKTIYDFTVKDASDEDVSLEKYRGKVVIIVNVASQCGYTDNHYRELKELQDKYYDKGLRVAAFPSNQFGSQEPAPVSEVEQFVKEKYNYEPDLYAKVNVNGDQAEPLWNFLKSEQGGLLIDAIKWNFTKFLVNRKGHVVKRYAPTTSPAQLEEEIKGLLSEEP